MTDKTTTPAPRKINYRSDFVAVLELTDAAGKPIPFPDCDFEAVFWTGNANRKYTISRRGDVLTNCRREPGGGIRVIFDRHGMGVGELKWEPKFRLPDGEFPDGYQDVMRPMPLGIILVTGLGDLPSAAEIAVTLPYIKGDKGEAFTYSDFTAEQIAGLRKPADDAAKDLQDIKETFDADEKARVKAETARQAAEQTRTDNEGKRVSAETARDDAETLRQQAENAREVHETQRLNNDNTCVINEQNRIRNEESRQHYEDTRQQAEQTRASNEITRGNNEQTREDAETARTNAEATRVDNETARGNAEQTRSTNENARRVAETERAAAEATRTANETSRQTAEETRQTAEQSRVTAETTRANTFAGFEATIASKQPAITASDDIAPLGSDKLALTPPAKYSAFDDVWVRLCGVYGGLDYSHTENNIAKPYHLNGLWLTRNEAIDIVSKYRTWGTPQEDFSQSNIRTNIPIAASSSRTYSNSYNNIEVANLAGCFPKTIEACFVGGNITSIINFKAEYLIRVSRQSFSAPNLVTLDIRNLKINLDLSKCPLINLASWQGLVSRAANTDAITVTVHPDVYAKLNGDTTNAAASALTEAELAQWQALVAQAAEKQITFATT